MVRNLLPLLEILSILYGLAAAYGCKLKFNIYAVVFIVSDLVLMVGINDYDFPRCLIAISYALMLIYCFINYERSAIKALINVGLTIVILGIFQLLVYFVLASVTKNNDIGGITWEFITMLICLCITIVVIPKLHISDLSDFLLKHKKLLAVIGCFALLVFGNGVWKIKKYESIGGKDVISIIYFFFLLVLLLGEWQKARRDAEKRKTQLEMNRLYYSAYEELIRSVREKQHDFKNHLNALRGMMYIIDDYDELIRQEGEYIDSLLNINNKTSILTMIENPLIAGFISEKIRCAMQKGIQVEHHCILNQKELGIPEYELVEMFGILIDNAVEALDECTDNKEMYINLVCQQKTLLFDVSNVCESISLDNLSEMFQINYSSKGKNRGIGLSKLMHMVKEKKGEVFAEPAKMGDTNGIKIGFCIPIQKPIA